jgi:hypothetical protein
MTKRWDFLYMRQEVHEIFEQSWKVFEEHQQGPGHQGPGQPGPGGGENAVTGSTEAATGKQKGQFTASKTKPKGAEDPKPKAPELKPKTPDGKKSPFEVALVDAQITRKNYMAVTSKAALVTENILTNKAWEWARGCYQEKIMKLTFPIKALATAGFARIFLMQQLKDVKKEYCQNDLLTHTLKFSKDFDVLLANAQKLFNKLITMQSEAMK